MKTAKNNRTENNVEKFSGYSGSIYFSWEQEPKYFSHFNSSGLGKGPAHFFHSLLQYGDYDRSCHIERANVRYMEENFPDDILIVIGAYGSTCAAIPIDCENPEIFEALNSLESYPCLNDEMASEIETEILYEAFEDTIGDIVRQAEREHDILIDEDAARKLFEDIWPADYGHVEAGGVGYIDSDRIYDEINAANLETWKPFEL